MTMNVSIDRLRISLHGVSAQMVEAAVDGLDVELRRRLGLRGLDKRLNGNSASVNIAELALSPAHLDAASDSAGLRGLIADRLLDVIETHYDSTLGSSGGDL
ncbi:MAG: hypothetical protein GY819_13080 [Planctomycetaceae bacterium]|nr:hypothetical protein [Planctomycetaceae bacterium]